MILSAAESKPQKTNFFGSCGMETKKKNDNDKESGV
jgi:hypothetical protein